MKKRRFLMLLCLFFGAILMGCNEKETEVIEQPEIKEETKVVEFTNEKNITVSTGVEADLTEGLIATYDGIKLKINVTDDGGYSLGKLGKINVTYEASYGKIKGTYSREVTVNYYGLSLEELNSKEVSSEYLWTFRSTAPVKNGNEWSKHVVDGHSSAWNKFEDSTGLVMLGSDTEGRLSTTEVEDDEPNTLIYNKIKFFDDSKSMRVYLSPNPYPDYNNLRTKYRINVLNLETNIIECLQDWTELTAPVPTSGAIDTTWYNKLQKETFVDLDISKFAGKEVIVFIEQDSSSEVYQKEFYKSLGFSNKDANDFIKETRDALVVYDIMVYNNDTSMQDLNVLFVGNSLTYYYETWNIFATIAASEGYKVNVDSVTSGGYYLSQMDDPNDKVGSALHSKLENRKYDIVVIQDNSTGPILYRVQFYDAVRSLKEKIEKNGAKVYLYETFSRESRSPDLAKFGLNYYSMTQKLVAEYAAIAEELNLTVSHVGTVFYDLYTNNPQFNLYDNDYLHQSELGSYVVALTHYATIYGKSPLGINYKYFEDEVKQKIIEEAVNKAVFGESILDEEYRVSSIGVTAK